MFHPDVGEVLIASRPSERWGREVVAIVALRSGASTNELEIAEVAGRHIARFKLPKAWIFVDKIARLSSGKPDRRWATVVAAAIDEPER